MRFEQDQAAMRQKLYPAQALDARRLREGIPQAAEAHEASPTGWLVHRVADL